MEINNSNAQSFNGVYLTQKALFASPRTHFKLNNEYKDIKKLANDVDIFINKKIFHDPECLTDLTIKVQEKLPEATTKLDKIKNFFKAPFLKSEKGIAGWNWGMYDDPLEVATALKTKLMQRLANK